MQRENIEYDPFAEAPVGLARLGTDGSVEHVNRQLCDLLGYPPEELTRMRFLQVVHPEDLKTDQDKFAYLLRQKRGEFSLVKRLRRADGSSVIVHLSIRLVQNSAGDCDHFIVALQNMSKIHQRLEQLERRTRHDRLTNILNRAGFTEYVHDAFRAYQRDGTHFALAYLDLDGFKRINDTMGHVTGDMLLKGVASRLYDAVGRDGVVARIGGDEFAILLNEIAAPDQMYGVNYRVNSAFAAPFLANGHLVTVSASIGFARCPEDATSVRHLLQHADREMYARKKPPLPTPGDDLSPVQP